jgi:hypothetical protein
MKLTDTATVATERGLSGEASPPSSWCRPEVCGTKRCSKQRHLRRDDAWTVGRGVWQRTHKLTEKREDDLRTQRRKRRKLCRLSSFLFSRSRTPRSRLLRQPVPAVGHEGAARGLPARARGAGDTHPRDQGTLRLSQCSYVFGCCSLFTDQLI